MPEQVEPSTEAVNELESPSRSSYIGACIVEAIREHGEQSVIGRGILSLIQDPNVAEAYDKARSMLGKQPQ